MAVAPPQTQTPPGLQGLRFVLSRVYLLQRLTRVLVILMEPILVRQLSTGMSQNDAPSLIWIHMRSTRLVAVRVYPDSQLGSLVDS